MSNASYEGSYYKVANLAELPVGSPRVFRAAGATVVVRRDPNAITAIDGSCLQDGAKLSHDERLREILDCVSAGAGSSPNDCQRLLTSAGLPVRVERDEVWVCIESCGD